MDAGALPLSERAGQRLRRIRCDLAKIYNFAVDSETVWGAC